MNNNKKNQPKIERMWHHVKNLQTERLIKDNSDKLFADCPCFCGGSEGTLQ